MKQLNIKFRYDGIDTEEVRECIEDKLGVEIMGISETEFCTKCEEEITYYDEEYDNGICKECNEEGEE